MMKPQTASHHPGRAPLAALVPPFITANHISLFRIGLGVVVGVWGVLGASPLAIFLVGLAAGLSDLLDGAVARYRGEETSLGALLDPVGDKVLALACLAVFWQRGWLSPWLILALLALETHAWLIPLLIIIGRLRRGESLSPFPRTKPNRAGKIKTFVVISSLGLILLALIFDLPWLRQAAMVILWLAAAMGLVALVGYFAAWWQGEWR